MGYPATFPAGLMIGCHLGLNSKLVAFHQRPDLTDVEVIEVGENGTVRVISRVSGKEHKIHPIVIVGSRIGCGFGAGVFELLTTTQPISVPIPKPLVAA